MDILCTPALELAGFEERVYPDNHKRAHLIPSGTTAGWVWSGVDQLFPEMREDIASARALTATGSRGVFYVGWDCRTRAFAVYWDAPTEKDSSTVYSPFPEFHLPFIRYNADELGVGRADEPPANPQTLMEEIRRSLSKLVVPNLVRIIPARVLGEDCICVEVWRKGIIPVGSWLLPKHVGEARSPIRVRVYEAALIRPLMAPRAMNSIRVNAAEQPTLYSGAQIGAMDADGSFVAGTLGCFVRDGSNQLYGLTSAHVLDQLLGDVDIYQPALGPNLCGQVEVIARVQDTAGTMQDLLVATSDEDAPRLANCTHVDVGFIRLHRPFSPRVNPNFNQADWAHVALHSPPHFGASGRGRDLQVDQRVYKSGQASGLTTGIVTEPFGIGNTYSVTTDGLVFCHLLECFCIRSESTISFATGGDSGSGIFTVNADQQNEASLVGLLYAGNGRYSCAIAIEDICQRFNVTVITE